MARRKLKRKSARTAKAARKSADPVVPTYLHPRASMQIGLHDIVKALKMIQRHRKLDSLALAARKAKAVLNVPAGTVNFVKDFVAENGMHKDAIGKHIVNGRGRLSELSLAGDARLMTMTAARAGGDPNQCDFGSEA